MAKTYNPQGRDGKTSTKLPRNPDPVYQCGFNANRRALIDCIRHWQRCTHEACHERLVSHENLKAYLNHKYGDGTLPPDRR